MTGPATTLSPEWVANDNEAVDLANANYVEVAWILRGMNDRAEGYDADDAGVYRYYYARGWNAVTLGDVVGPGLAWEIFKVSP